MQGLWEGGWAVGLIQKMCFAGSWRADLPISLLALAVAHSPHPGAGMGEGVHVSVSGRMTKWFCGFPSVSAIPL